MVLVVVVLVVVAVNGCLLWEIYKTKEGMLTAVYFWLEQLVINADDKLY